MSKKTLFDLICGALPCDFEPEILKGYGRPEWWQNNMRLACAYALRKCPNLDWRAYLAHYPDIKAAGVDPILHFLEEGVFEGRQLFVKNATEEVPAVTAPACVQPKVSVVVCNYNNELYLGHALNSLINQTLRDIEIIIVDDASTDNSLALINALAGSDPRIKVIAHERNQSQHMARKHGVAMASGEYIMFLDSDDYYAANACEVAYNAICGRYDFVEFNAIPQYAPDAAPDLLRMNRYFSRAREAREFERHEIMRALCKENAFYGIVWTKICAAPYCKATFAKMADKPLFRTQDEYEVAALASQAGSAARIEDRLYFYRVGIGVAAALELAANYERYADTGDSWLATKEWLGRYGHISHIERLKKRFVLSSIKVWLRLANADNCERWFDAMAAQYGIVDLLCGFNNYFVNDIVKIANKFQDYSPDLAVRRPVVSIGIYYPKLVNGGAERVTWDLANLLAQAGYEVTVFLNNAHENDLRLKPPVKVAYIGAGAGNLESHLLGWRVALAQNPVDLILHQHCYGPVILWQLMLLKYLRIPVVVFTHSSFVSPLYKRNSFTMQLRLAILRCAAKVSVLSRYDELFTRNQGVDACHIPNPVRLPPEDWRPRTTFAQRRRHILVFCRLGSGAKNVRDCLRILKEARRRMPQLQMTFVGSFADDFSQEKFYKLAKELEVEPYIHVTGWLEDAAPFIDGTGVLLSAAHVAAFELAIAESQARGLPTVMYDFPADPGEDNPAIIRVPQGDVSGAAREIVALLGDEARWQRLSQIAMQKMRRFSGRNYVAKVTELIKTFDKLSPYTPYKPRDYETVLKMLAFYGANVMPWVLERDKARA